ETIDAAPTFTEVLQRFQDWLKKHGIIQGEGSSGYKKSKTPKPKHSSFRSRNHNNQSPLHHVVNSVENDFTYGASFCFITDGPFDIRDFISKQCLHSQISRPSYFAQSYLDIRTLFRDFFDLANWCNLEGMLTFLGETFTGRQHSGICDTRMVALIAKKLAEGFSKVDDHPVFAEANRTLLVQQWNSGKLDKLKQGCVLKANRSTNQSFVKMISFNKLKRIEARVAASTTVTEAAEARSSRSDDDDDKDVDSKSTDTKDTDTKGGNSKGSCAKGAGAKGAGTKGGADAGTEDAGTKDAGTEDSGTMDDGTKNAGAEDLGVKDVGSKDDNIKDAGAKDAGKDTRSSYLTSFLSAFSLAPSRSVEISSAASTSSSTFASPTEPFASNSSFAAPMLDVAD
ncbi:hypothetical protein BGZ65_001775, partial [Modicella reniformis]